MDRQKLLKYLVILMFFIFGLDYLGRTFYWYSAIWYFDIITHFLSGVWVGMFFIYLFIRKGKQANAIKILLSVLFIGILWEVFEFIVYQRLGGIPFNILDTLLDIFFDFLGGSLALLYFLKSATIIKKSAV